MPLVSVNDISMHYQHFAAERPTEPGLPPILLLSGMGSDSMSWQPAVLPLRQQYQLLIPDNRCTGRTKPATVSSSRDAMVSDLLALLDHAGVERVNVVGHSMGGMLGWALACTAPERVANLVAAAALPQILPARIALFNSLRAVRTPHNETEWFSLLYQFLFKADFFDDADRVEMTLAASVQYPFKQELSAFAEQVRALESFLPALPLHQLRCPVTLITGDQDVLTTPRMLDRFATQYPQVTVPVRTHIVQGAAHALHWDQPTEFTRLVIEALSQNAAAK